ncbi:MAG: hypothetical protein H0V38_07900 [Sporichthyaceae bacterium]|nr:hypothetical protein [Sporichthyaceae bacterium]
MTDPASSSANPYVVPLAALERRTRVSPEDQVTEDSDSSGDAAAWAWNEERRQAQLAGGA